MTATDSTRGRWLHPFSGSSSARLRLLCFPHAGGTPLTFRNWPRWVSDDIAVEAVSYPGRLERIDEEPVDDMLHLLETFEEAYYAAPPRPTVFFGHSMGAAIAHEMTLRLAGTPWRPLLLVVSGRAAPHLAKGRGVAAQGDEAIVADVVHLSPDSAKAMAEPELRELLLPAIRADYALIDAYPMQTRPVVDIPILALGGANDPIVTSQEARQWEGYTNGIFAYREFEGDHFFLNKDTAAVIRTVEKMTRLVEETNAT